MRRTSKRRWVVDSPKYNYKNQETLCLRRKVANYLMAIEWGETDESIKRILENRAQFNGQQMFTTSFTVHQSREQIFVMKFGG